MAKKKPLVLDSNNQPQLLQSGDYIGDESFVVQTNGESGTTVIGTVGYQSAADTVKKAKADAAGTMRADFIQADTSILTSASGNYQTEGIITLTTAQWDAVAGTTGGLTFKSAYYVSNGTAGQLTATAPTTGFSQIVGRALSSTEMKLTFEQVYQL